MSDIIHLLPDSIANQIAAGEVIQRPASVVKELIENAVDAGADQIQVVIKDAGRSLIQVIDNGKGMSETDARMAFERHATSKIRTAQDLFALRTMGFRGEALASIAAVAQVELRTARATDEMGTLIQIAGSQVEWQESVIQATGSIFSVKNLFFNVPARRKFLKSNDTEFKNILSEFERVALVNPEIAFTLWHNDTEVYNLPVSNSKSRVVNVFGKKLAPSLLPLQIDTSLIRISGFIGAPSSSKKRGAQQFFFINGRYMRHPYFHRAVLQAFEPYIPAGDQPNYFLYFTVDPAAIDVNIHPTKTEIKFENEQAIWQIISTAIKEAIAVPSLEFDQEDAIEMPVYTGRPTVVAPPKAPSGNDYNPFRERPATPSPPKDWQRLYEKPEPLFDEAIQSTLFTADDRVETPTPTTATAHLQYKDRYIVLSLRSGLSIIDQRRAHIRVLFDEFMRRMQNKQGVSQQLLFPEIISFTPKEATVLPCLLDDLGYMGFDLGNLGNNAFSINGVPSGLDNLDMVEVLQNMVDKVLETGCEVREEVIEALALSLARQSAIGYGKTLSEEEVFDLVAKLFASSSPTYTPDGKLIISVVTDNDLTKRFG